eukprot:11337010-Alexandrium_andersonii.AAC.1
MRNMQNRLRRSDPELRGPRNGLNIGPPSSRGVRSVALFAHSPNPPTELVIEGVRSRGIARL